MKRKYRMKKLLVIIAVLMFTGAWIPVGVNAYVKHAVKNVLLTAEEAASLNTDCILVLGAGVWADGTPSHMLEDRVLQGVYLHRLGASDRLLMSGDHGRKDSDEVNAMKKLAVEKGVEPDKVFMDHAGFSTYESMYRAKEVFGVRTVLIVTQKYHLYRAVYIAEKLGLEAWGVASDQRSYAGQDARNTREFLARNKDFFFCLFQPKPTYLGETVPISGSGALTDD